MKIAILGSVALPVPPPAQGVTEWIAYFQAMGLAKRGHKVLLFAAYGSKTGDYELIEVGKGDTVVGSKQALESSIQRIPSESSIPNSSDNPPSGKSDSLLPISSTNLGSGTIGRGRYSELVSSDLSQQRDINIESSRGLRKENVYLGEVIEQLIKRKDDYDVILNNMRGEAVLLPVAKLLDKPFVNVMHLPLFPELAEAFKTYNTNIITISNAQRKGFTDLNYLATVNNCVDTEKFVVSTKSEIRNPNVETNSNDQNSKNSNISNFDICASDLNSDYILMMGTIGRHKNQAGAIRIAKETGMKLVLAGKIRDQDYFEELKKDIDGIQIKWVGEMGFEKKLKLYQNAKVFIFPILWEEPFGLVMIEAMACGVPVVAYNNGAIPEVVVNGVNGFVIESGNEKEMISAVKNIGIIKREDCRKYVEEHFTVEKMVADYEKALSNLTLNI